MSEASLQRARPLRNTSVLRAVAAFLLAGLVVLSVVGAVLVWSQHRTATAEAIRNARTLTNLEATDVVGPALTDQALAPGPEQTALDRIVRARVLGTHIVRIKIWDTTGLIRYSDESSLIGQRFTLAADERAALEHTGRTSAEVSSLAAAENTHERQFGKLLQVYQGLRTPTGTPLLFETYQPYSVITDTSRRMWLASLPILLGGLALLYLVQAPLAYRMGVQLRRSQDEREGLLVATLAASDRERASIAADLHDGVVQGLAGASLTLSAGADKARATAPAAAEAMSSAATDLRRWLRELRSLVVTITPPALHAQGLASSLSDLGASLEARGLAVTIDVTGTEDLDETTEVLLYRAAQEGVRNIIRHAEATSAHLTASREPGGLVLCLRDNGTGLPADSTPSRRSGSVGLELLGQLVGAHGGSLEVVTAPEGGTRLTVRIPAQEGSS